jgi:hypothetical protein
VQSVNGEIFVKVQNGYELEELHNVEIVDPTDLQILAYDEEASMWRNTDAPAGGGGITVSDTAPETTAIGSTWFNSSDGTTYIYYDSFWVPISPSKIGPPGVTGPQGETGPTGATGEAGPNGFIQQAGTPSSTDVLWLDTDEEPDVPVPTGGTTGQALTKTSATDYDTQWRTLVPAGGTTNQVLTKSSGTDYASDWATPITPGLVPIIPTSVTTVSGSASINTTTGVITFTGVGTLNIDGCFSSAYNYYKVIHISSGATANAGLRVNLRAAGTNYVTGNQKEHTVYYSASGGVTVTGGEAQTSINFGWIQGVANSLNSHSFEILNPFNPAHTNYTGTFSSYVSGTSGGGVPTTTQYDGLSLTIGANTHSGTIKIYGYN